MTPGRNRTRNRRDRQDRDERRTPDREMDEITIEAVPPNRQERRRKNRTDQLEKDYVRSLEVLCEDQRKILKQIDVGIDPRNAYKKLKTQSKTLQIVHALISGVYNVIASMILWFGPATLSLMLEDKMEMTQYQERFLIPMPFFGAFFGAAAAYHLADKMSRRVVLFLATLISCISWSFVLNPANFTVLLVAQAFNGFAAGNLVLTNMYYTSEVLVAKYSRYTEDITLLSHSIGMAIMQSFACYWENWEVVAGCGLFWSMTGLFWIFIFAPSPYYKLETSGKYVDERVLCRNNLESQKAFRRFLHEPLNSLKQPREIAAEFLKARYIAQVNKLSMMKGEAIFSSYKALAMCVSSIFIFARTFSGFFTYLFYSTSFLAETEDYKFSRRDTLMLVGSYVLMRHVALSVNKSRKRSKYLMLSTVGAVSSSMILAIIYFLENVAGFDTSNYMGFLKYVLVGTVVVSYAIGWDCIPDLYSKEGSPSKAKYQPALLLCAVQYFSIVLVTVVYSIFPYLEFWCVLYAALPASVYWFFSPLLVETYNKSEEEIDAAVKAVATSDPLFSELFKDLNRN